LCQKYLAAVLDYQVNGFKLRKVSPKMQKYSQVLCV
jgi:hypothetical protein